MEENIEKGHREKNLDEEDALKNQVRKNRLKGHCFNNLTNENFNELRKCLFVTDVNRSPVTRM